MVPLVFQSNHLRGGRKCIILNFSQKHFSPIKEFFLNLPVKEKDYKSHLDKVLTSPVLCSYLHQLACLLISCDAKAEMEPQVLAGSTM
jgi:hypothetical protein